MSDSVNPFTFKVEIITANGKIIESKESLSTNDDTTIELLRFQFDRNKILTQLNVFEQWPPKKSPLKHLVKQYIFLRRKDQMSIDSTVFRYYLENGTGSQFSDTIVYDKEELKNDTIKNYRLPPEIFLKNDDPYSHLRDTVFNNDGSLNYVFFYNSLYGYVGEFNRFNYLSPAVYMHYKEEFFNKKCIRSSTTHYVNKHPVEVIEYDADKNIVSIRRISYNKNGLVIGDRITRNGIVTQSISYYYQ